MCQRDSPRSRGLPQRSAWLSFTLIVSFDFVITLFLWIVFVQQEKSIAKSISPHNGTDDNDIFNFDIKEHVFDLALSALLRSLVGVIFYSLLRWITRIPIVCVTLVTTAYLIAKAIVFNYGNQAASTATQPLYYVILFFILISSLILPWFSAFFFEFKYLPAELSQYSDVNWRIWQTWLWPRALKRVSANAMSADERSNEEVQSLNSGEGRPSPNGPLAVSQGGYRNYGAISSPYMTPVGSIGDIHDLTRVPSPYHSEQSSSNHTPSDMDPLLHQKLAKEPSLPVADTIYTARKEQLVRSIDELLEESVPWRVVKSDARVTVYTFVKNGMKIWRGDSMYNYSIDELWRVLYYQVELQPQWNSQVMENTILCKIDDEMDIVYSMTAPAAGGMVTSRDFVNLRVKVERPGQFMSLGTAVEQEDKPPQAGIIRGENRTSAYVLSKRGENETLFTWIFQTDLKGWLPRYLIDQSLTGIIIATLTKFHEHMDKE